MRHLTLSILVTLAVLLGSAGEGFALPECPGTHNETTWTNCEGTYTTADGTNYVGEWKDGIFNGQGTLTFASGGKYVGQYKDGKRHGQGTYYYLADNQFKGSKYVGEYKDGKKHGQGTYTFADGDKYVGEFKDDKKYGQGIYTKSNGEVFEGIFENDKFKYAQKVTPTVTAKKTPSPSKGESFALPECPGSPKTGPISIVRSWNNCKGTLTLPWGVKYVGEWKDGNKHGQGTLTYANGDKYVGEYKDGKRHGQGTETHADGKVFEGIWENGGFKYAQKVTPTVTAKKSSKKSSGSNQSSLPECPGSPKTGSLSTVRSWNNCKGTYTHTDGNKYFSEWKDGKPHGQGTLYFLADNQFKGDIYVGEFKDGNKHGQGTYTFANGDKYVGEHKDGESHGQGTYTYASGDKYVGEYKDGKKHGQGTLTFASGEKHVGEWKDGKRHGQGTHTFADGAKYVGQYKDGKRHGQGTYTTADGNKYVGEFKGNKKHGQGTVTFADGDKYVGELKDGKQHGQGTYTFADGREVKGIFENGQFKYAQKVTPTVTAKKSPEPSSEVQNENERLRKKIARLEKEKKQKSKPPKQVAKKTPKPKTLQFKKVPKRPDDIAVIIANSNYKKLGKGIPNVTPAYADAEGIKRYFMNAKGVREGNIIFLKDATKAQMTSVFGSKEDHKGKLFNWVKPNISKVYVYYAGHGAPAGDKGTTYLVPSDTDNETVQLTAYPLNQLYSNLGKIPATSITVILEACFSGQSQGGTLFSQTSGISIVPKMPLVPSKITVISAGAAKQVASWEKDNSQSLFTKYFLTGMSGEGDRKPYGNGDGKVSLKELKKYLNGTMTYYARRYYGRTQTAQMIVNGRELSVSN